MRRQTAGAASLLFFVALFRCSFFFSSLTWPPRIAVVYNASNNELERTKTLVKNAIIVIDATPFKQWCVGRVMERRSPEKEKILCVPLLPVPQV